MIYLVSKGIFICNLNLFIVLTAQIKIQKNLYLTKCSQEPS